MTTSAKKVERGTLYLAGALDKVDVKPEDGRKFSLRELQRAVGGFIETMISAERFTTVYVNEEGALCKDFLPNLHTWKFANRHVYVDLNGYPSNFLVMGNALVVRKVAVDREAATTYGVPALGQFFHHETAQ
jgi:hypothetical protein